MGYQSWLAWNEGQVDLSIPVEYGYSIVWGAELYGSGSAR
jgi:hypothetical protein